MTFQEIFAEVKQLFSSTDISHIKENIAFQFDITGEGEGSFYAEVKDGKLTIEPYAYHDRDVLLRANADTFLKIAKGETDPVAAFTFGKLKVEGDIGKALIVKEFIKSK